MNTVFKNHIKEELLEKLPDIKHHYIESENPEHHWNFLKVDNEIVADLGCGLHMIEGSWDTTPDFFIKKGAKKVIGVDTENNDIFNFNKRLIEHKFYCDRIDSVSKLEFYINDHNISSLKMDIEGYESLFLDSKSYFKSLKYVAIETHSKELLNKMIIKLLDLGFQIDIVCTFYPRVYDICNLIYASRV